LKAQVIEKIPGTTAKQVAKTFSVTERTVRQWCVNRKIPFYKIGGLVRFDMSEVHKHIREKCLREAK
jgi:excisionase family DNA binding protein